MKTTFRGPRKRGTRRRATAATCAAAVVEIGPDELQSDRLGTLFRNGAGAVVLVDDHRVERLYRRCVLSDEGVATATPWAISLPEMARNHVAGDHHTGDMLRFVEGQFAHIARKSLVQPAADGQMRQLIPHELADRDRWFALASEDVMLAWHLIGDVWRSMSSGASEVPPPAMTIELLKYPDSTDDLQRIGRLLVDSGGRWSQVGSQLDGYKEQAVGPFDNRVVRDLFACGMMVPGMRLLLKRINRLFYRETFHGVPGDMQVIGAAHIDGLKSLSVLIADRDVVRTEVNHGGQWHELPLGIDRMAILPGPELDRQWKIPPTLHRVLLKKNVPSAPIRKPNVTMALSVTQSSGWVSRFNWHEIAPRQ